MTVELVYDRGCINVAEARRNLSRALAAAGRRKRWTEWVASDPCAPAHVRGFGSPTILIDGRDVAGATAGGQPCCRLYAEAGRLNGAPSVEDIASAIRQAAKPVSFHLLDGAPGIGVALLPKVACPACWPAFRRCFLRLASDSCCQAAIYSASQSSSWQSRCSPSRAGRACTAGSDRWSWPVPLRR